MLQCAEQKDTMRTGFAGAKSEKKSSRACGKSFRPFGPALVASLTFDVHVPLKVSQKATTGTGTHTAAARCPRSFLPKSVVVNRMATTDNSPHNRTLWRLRPSFVRRGSATFAGAWQRGGGKGLLRIRPSSAIPNATSATSKNGRHTYHEVGHAPSL
jgi:hypothetical protein